MDCREVKNNIHPFMDNELDDRTSQMVKEHLSACPLCSLELEQEKKIDFLIKNNIPKEKASYELKETILNRIAKLEEKRISRFASPVLKPALIGITGVVLIFISFSLLNRPFPVYSEAVGEHIQFLQGKIPISISSDKPSEVNKWLLGQLDFKVMTPDLSSQGVMLQGARVCDIKGKKAAYLMYAKNEHNLSVFMFDAKSLKFPKAKRVSVNDKLFYVDKERGYNSVLWLDDGIACVFVSDLGEAELLHLASL